MSISIAADETAAARRDRAFLGHPAGLGWLAFSELWERFSYYGMTALLVLYLAHSLLTGSHSANVIGFGPFQAAVETLYGKAATPLGLASHIYALYTAFVYLTPLAGGWLADRFLGRTAAVTTGALLMALGHFLMAFEASFLLALLCLLTGVGLFKGNIASQVGDLYKSDDPRRANAFQIFLLSVQIAVIVSPLICGTLGEVYGWGWGFGAAGVGMLIGLLTYLFGRRNYPPEPVRQREIAARPPLSGQDWTKIAVLMLLLPVMAASLCGNQQIGNAYPLWAETHFNLVFFGKTMPTSWLQSVDAIFSTGTLLIVIAFWRWWETRWAEPDELAKMTIGVAISSLAPLALAAASAIVAATHAKVGVSWAFAFELLNDIGFANVVPVGLALYSRAAPKGMTGLIIGIYYLHLFAGNLFTGWLGGLLDTMPATRFWLLHAGIMGTSAVVLLVARLAFGRVLAPAYGAPDSEPAQAAA
ncbi:MAG TPA: oligopeptide:H+ symporter [Rhizomicrobium sp.]|nr:oligopeptide:H+ symporter [Rhizomicrobium sp.]